MRIESVGSFQKPVAAAPQTEAPAQRVESTEAVDSAAVAAMQPQKPEKAMDGENDNHEAVMNDEMLKKAVDRANKSLTPFDRVIERSVHEKTHAIMYVIRDTKTKEVIAEFPPKKIEDMIAKMWELAGMFVNEKV